MFCFKQTQPKTPHFVPFPNAVLAEVDKYAEVEYSMVRSPVVSQSYIDLGLKVPQPIYVTNITMCTCMYLLEKGFGSLTVSSSVPSRPSPSAG